MLYARKSTVCTITFRIILLSIKSLTTLYTTKKSILYYYTDPTVYEKNSCMMYISLIEALLTKYEGAENV